MCVSYDSYFPLCTFELYIWCCMTYIVLVQYPKRFWKYICDCDRHTDALLDGQTSMISFKCLSNGFFFLVLKFSILTQIFDALVLLFLLTRGPMILIYKIGGKDHSSAGDTKRKIRRRFLTNVKVSTTLVLLTIWIWDSKPWLASAN